MLENCNGRVGINQRCIDVGSRRILKENNVVSCSSRDADGVFHFERAPGKNRPYFWPIVGDEDIAIPAGRLALEAGRKLLETRCITKRCALPVIDLHVGGTERFNVPDKMNRNRNAASAGQHDIEERRAFAQHDEAIMAALHRLQGFGGDSRFRASARNISAVPAILRDRHMRAKRPGRASAYFHQGAQRHLKPCLHGLDGKVQDVVGPVSGKSLLRCCQD